VIARRFVGVEVDGPQRPGSDDSGFIATRTTRGSPVDIPASSPPARLVSRR
jgi:hypothetical protein